MAEIDKNSLKTASVDSDHIKLKDKYISAIGRRKTSTAQVRLYKNGQGAITVNGFKADQYFKDGELLTIAGQPLKLSGLVKDINLSIMVSGGGKKCQAEAIRHGIARTLVLINPELKPSLKVKGWVKRDARKKERKKPGLKKARRAPQWAKR
ncbi:30S ribosomal protein S9 [Candidatus Falkowbacteria bacterium RIFCSPLOWO2_12_FULL_45_13]|uniref:Small ribosomal subunit protein uS9 n=2 Tax=Candidatus Falkowiibacteriota TaxID=1752728 RepID=A0A1F5SBZ4_9BACT|nr:MAG: 30S ribosomal protein S9 [Candidatus Falkowbacteria bacterium RIFCSPLOWO2_02_FULL_45_21]OGF31985.1 MAG: 30S ribosomal protein S9 [Candidatus Falkowbacteria bacterium RIFCSPLOWO2_12_FULL_45_13]